MGVSLETVPLAIGEAQEKTVAPADRAEYFRYFHGTWPGASSVGPPCVKEILTQEDDILH